MPGPNRPSGLRSPEGRRRRRSKRANPVLWLHQNRSTYVAVYTASLDKAIHGGFILNADRAPLLAQAQQIQLPS